MNVMNSTFRSTQNECSLIHFNHSRTSRMWSTPAEVLPQA